MDRKLYDAIIGFAVGDAIGLPYESRQRGHFTCTGMVGYGTHGQPLGTWSGNTSLTLATLASLKKSGGRVVTDDMRDNYRDWLIRGLYTARGETFDASGTTERALMEWQPGRSERDNDNGALKRVLPLAFVDCTDDDVRNVSAITHAHWISKEACVIYVNVAARLLDGEAIGDIIPTLDFFKPFERLNELNHYGRGQIRSGIDVVGTLEAALWAVSREGDWKKGFKQDVLHAVNLGGDTNTVGALTGGLAGIIYGVDEARDWADLLVNRQEIVKWLW